MMMSYSSLPSYRPRFPLPFFYQLEEEERTKGGIAFFGLLTQPRVFCSLTTISVCYRGRTRRHQFVFPSFRSRSPHPFPVVFSGRPARCCCTCKAMASESKESANPVRPLVFLFPSVVPIPTHLDPPEGQASRTTRDQRRGRPPPRTKAASPRPFRRFSARAIFHPTTARAGPCSATHDNDDDRDDD